METVEAATAGIPVQLVFCNAGYCTIGLFTSRCPTSSRYSHAVTACDHPLRHVDIKTSTLLHYLRCKFTPSSLNIALLPILVMHYRCL
jgi:hypothetical protein